jgi:hypothetical protein
MGFKIPGISLLFAVLMLTGCLGRTDLTSEMTFSNADKADGIFEVLTESVFQKAKNLTDNCAIYARGANCRFDDTSVNPYLSASTISISIGKDDNGHAYLSIHSATTGWGIDAASLKNGDYISKTHLEWEAWAASKFKDFDVLSKRRFYSEIGDIGTF